MTRSNNPEAGGTTNAPNRHAVTRALTERLRYEDTLKSKRAEVGKKEMEKVSGIEKNDIVTLADYPKGIWSGSNREGPCDM